jgi:folate-binding protein YgfZ
MSPVWREVLEASGARFDEMGLPRFPAVAADTNPDCQLFDLSHLGLIAIAGDDASGFLQGQLTNDVRELSDTHAQWSSHCSQKGRMLANFLIFRITGTHYLQLPGERISDLLKRLRMFVLRSRVSITDVSDDWARIAVAGDGAAAAISDLGLPIPTHENGLAHAAGLTLVRVPGPTARIEIIGSPDDMSEHWLALARRATLMDREGWTLLDIRAGIPQILDRTADSFVPQMVNLHLIDGVSFNKGCYTGQEVVARMQYLGKLKRRMYLAEVETDTPPQPGDPLDSPDSRSQQGSGSVVMASPSGPGRYELLAVAEIQAAESGEMRLGAGGPRLRLQPPPYGFPIDETDPT